METTCRKRKKRNMTLCTAVRALRTVQRHEGCAAVEIAILEARRLGVGCPEKNPSKKKARYRSRVASLAPVPKLPAPIPGIKFPEINLPSGDWVDDVKSAEERLREARKAIEEARKAIDAINRSRLAALLLRWPWARALFVALVTTVFWASAAVLFAQPIVEEAGICAEERDTEESELNRVRCEDGND